MARPARFFTQVQSESTAASAFSAHNELIASLTRINVHNPPVQTCSTGWSFSGLYNGPTGVAYLFFRLSQLYPDLVFKGQSLLDWSQSYLDLSVFGRHPPPSPDHCGIASEVLAQLALRAVIEKDPSLVQQLCSYANTINDIAKSGSNEWLYGRAGYLYFLRLARSAFSADEHANTHKLLNSTIEKTISRILSSKQPWTWQGKVYLGAAHGWAGIVCQMILSAPAACSTQVTPVVEKMLELQLMSGNFPSSLESESDQLVQFCHGGPGFVLAFRSIRPFCDSLQESIGGAILSAQTDLWQRGLLTKTPCLCHGIAGNALALDEEDETKWKSFLAFMTEEALEKHGWLADVGRSDKFASLFTGEAGRAWVWAVADKRLPRTCIGFNDL